MGGNTFKTPAARLTSAEHTALISYVRSRLKNVLDPIAAVPYLASKSSHGDLDLVCGWNGIGTAPGKGGSAGDVGDAACEGIDLLKADITLDSPKEEVDRWCTALAAALGGTRWLRSGQELSVAVPVGVLDACELRDAVEIPESPSLVAVTANEAISGQRTTDESCVTLTSTVHTRATINNDETVSNTSSGTIPPPSTPIKTPGSPTTGDHDEATNAPPSSSPQTESSSSLAAPQDHAPFYQVDLILCPSTAVPFAAFSQSYGMMGLLFSHYVRRATGLHGVCLQMPCVILRTRPFTSYKKIDVVLSTDPDAVCEWLGLDYGAWKDTTFATTQDLFRWLATVRPGSRGELALKLLANRGPSSRSKSHRMVILDEFGAWLRSNGWEKPDDRSEVLKDEGDDIKSNKTHSPSMSRSSTCTTASSTSGSASSQSDPTPAPLTNAEKAVLEYWGKMNSYNAQVDTLIRERDLLTQQISERSERRKREKARQEQQNPGEQTVANTTGDSAPASHAAEATLATESASSVKRTGEAELIVLTLPPTQDTNIEELDDIVLNNPAGPNSTNNSATPSSPQHNAARLVQDSVKMTAMTEETPALGDKASMEVEATPVPSPAHIPPERQGVVDEATCNVIVDSRIEGGIAPVMASTPPLTPPLVVESTPDFVNDCPTNDFDLNDESPNTPVSPVKPASPQNVPVNVEATEAGVADDIPPVVEVVQVSVDEAAPQTAIDNSPDVGVESIHETTPLLPPTPSSGPRDAIVVQDAPHVASIADGPAPPAEVDSCPTERLPHSPETTTVDTPTSAQTVGADAPDVLRTGRVGSGADSVPVPGTPASCTDDSTPDPEGSAAHPQEPSAPSKIEQEATTHQQDQQEVIGQVGERTSGSSSDPLPQTPNATPESPKDDKDVASARCPAITPTRQASETKCSIVGKKDKGKGAGKRDSCVIA